MRRPIFKRWIKRECLRLANTDRFSMAKLAALSQLPSDSPSAENDRARLAAALHLYSISNQCTQQFNARIYDDDLARIQRSAESHIGNRDIQRLALRGTPMYSLPEEYRDILSAYVDAYYVPENIAEEKRALCRDSRMLQLRIGATSTEIAKAVHTAPSNVSTYLAKGAIERVTLETARDIQRWLVNAEQNRTN